MRTFATSLQFSALFGLGVLAASPAFAQNVETRQSESRSESGSASGGAEGSGFQSIGPSFGAEIVLDADQDGNIIGTGPAIRIISPDFGGAAGGAGGGNGGTFFFSGPMDDEPSSLLQSTSVQKELEIVDDQREKLRSIRANTQKKIHEAMIGSIGKPREGRAEPQRPIPPQEMQEKMREIQADAAKEVDEVLLPHQKKRLQQIVYRKALKNRGTSDALAHGDLAKELKVTDEQKERLAKRAAEVQKELDKKIAKLRDEAREEILDELDSNQREKLKELLGADFDDKPVASSPRRIERREIRSSGGGSSGERSTDERVLRPAS